MLFEVTAQRSVADFGVSQQWQDTGGPLNFQLSIVLDESQFTYSETIPPEYLIFADYCFRGSLPIQSLAAQYIDETENFKSSSLASIETPKSASTSYELGLSQLSSVLKQLEFTHSGNGRTTHGGPYTSQDSLGMVVVKQTILDERLQMSADQPDVTAAETFDEYRTWAAS